MKRVILLCLVAFVAVFASCSSDKKEGDWRIVGPFGGSARLGAVTFKLGDEVYVGLGVDRERVELKDFWKTTDGSTWTEVQAEFPGDARYGAVAFVVDGRAYVGTGYTDNLKGSSQKWFKDFYVFDGTSWTTLAQEFPGDARYGAVAFTVGGKGYVGSGTIEKNKDVVNNYYAFDPATQTWGTAQTIGNKRKFGNAFVINNLAYICCGISDGGALQNDMWSFDGTKAEKLPALTNISSSKFDNDYDDIPRVYASTFIASRHGREFAYLVSGQIRTGITRTVFEFDPIDVLWREVEEIPRNPRIQAVGFSIGEKGFFTLGGVSDTNTDSETWEYTPGVKEWDENDA